MIWWVVLICVMVACAVGGGIYLRQARDAGEVEKFRDAMADLESELGKAFLPIVNATLVRLSRWLDRNKHS